VAITTHPGPGRTAALAEPAGFERFARQRVRCEGDMPTRGSLELVERELALLRTSRNQALLAFRQAG
jgi:hypothetical protein